MNMTQAELIRAYWPVLTVEERVQFLTNAAPETEHIELATGLDAEGQPEGCYVNHTEGFGGRFTGV